MPKKKSKKTSTFYRRHFPMFQSFFYVVISVIIAFVLFETGMFHEAVHSLKEFGYIGAFLCGMFFVSIFTAAPAAVVLLTLSETLPLVPLIIFAGFGSVLGDMIIMSFLTHSIPQTGQFVPKDKRIQKIIKSLRHTKYRFFLTIIGALVVASPLPDELGLALMGVSKLKPLYAIGVTFLLNTSGFAFLFYFLR